MSEQVKIAFYSDLHTEFQSKYQSQLNIDEEKDLYIFAGDFCAFKDAEHFLKTLRSQTNKPIILILGNHDFYHSRYDYVLRQYRQLCEQYHITLLEQEIYVNETHKLLIFGATFWADFKKQGNLDEIAMLWCKNRIADFSYIQDSNFRPMKPETMSQIAEQTLAKLKTAFSPKNVTEQGYEDYTKIVVSHFPPLTTLNNPKYQASLLDYYFKPDYTDYVSLADIWIYGHNHYNLRQWYKTEKHQTLVLSNQHGYINDRLKQRECQENQQPKKIHYPLVKNEDLERMGQDFYPNICLTITI